MKRHSGAVLSLSRTLGAGAAVLARAEKFRIRLPVVSFVVSMAIVLVSVIAPSYESVAAADALATAQPPGHSQTLAHSDHEGLSVLRDDYQVTQRPIAPAVGKPDPGTAQAIAYSLVLAKGWDEEQYSCLYSLWTRESHWNTFALNTSSGAYGIPQALPGSKMASAGTDWATNPETQIRWGLGYISSRYVTPCGAWEHSEDFNWY